MMTETDGQTMTEEMSFMFQSVGIGPVDTREKREGKIERINQGMYAVFSLIRAPYYNFLLL